MFIVTGVLYFLQLWHQTVTWMITLANFWVDGDWLWDLGVPGFHKLQRSSDIERNWRGVALLEPSLEAKEFPHCYKTMDNLVLKRRFISKIYTNLQQSNQIAPGS